MLTSRLAAARLVVADAAALESVARAAILSLHDELALDPKPGLVTLTSNGSHDDMDAATFLRSIASLRDYLRTATRIGAARAPFADLETLGIEAEARMSAATGGINTHRGAIFLLGLLCASAGASIGAGGDCSARTLRSTLESTWGEALRRRLHRHSNSNGARAARRFGLRGAAAEAADGFPTLFEHVMPALQAAKAAGLDRRSTQLQVLFTAMAVLDDTTLVHRGGLAGLRFAQSSARRFLDAGGAASTDALRLAREFGREFVARRLSPGGSADLLAAACWLDRIDETHPTRRLA